MAEVGFGKGCPSHGRAGRTDTVHPCGLVHGRPTCPRRAGYSLVKEHDAAANVKVFGPVPVAVRPRRSWARPGESEVEKSSEQEILRHDQSVHESNETKQVAGDRTVLK